MMLRRVLVRWVNEKLDFPFSIMFFVSFFFFVFFVQFYYVLSYLFALFVVKTCVSILWHTSLLKMQLLFEKIAKNDDFGDFKRFLTCVTYDVTVT